MATNFNEASRNPAQEYENSLTEKSLAELIKEHDRWTRVLNGLRETEVRTFETGKIAAMNSSWDQAVQSQRVVQTFLEKLGAAFDERGNIDVKNSSPEVQKIIEEGKSK